MTFLSRFGNMVVVDEPVYKSELTGGLGYMAGFYSQIADSTTITNTTTETSLIGSGIGSLSVPANTFLQGNAYTLKMGGFISCNNADQITIRIKSGSVILGTTNLITLSKATNQIWQVDANFIIRQIGTIGVASIKTHFVFSFEDDSSDSFISHSADVTNNTTFDTTTINALNVTAQWGTASVSDSIYTTFLNLNKIF